MITNTTIPPELENLIREISPDFILKSSRDKPIKKAVPLIEVGIANLIAFFMHILTQLRQNCLQQWLYRACN